jgi:mono/diheme cytochrome c family protein
MMMTTTEAPDIRYTVLTKGEHDEAHGEGPHQPYSDETIKRAITQGVDPAGNPLSWVMPRWDMTDEQFNDLLDFIKTLE